MQSRVDKQKISKEKFKQALKKKFNFIRCLKYTSNHRKSKFKCSECGNIWESKPYDTLKTKYGCPECARIITALRKKWDINDIRRQFAERRPDLTLLSTARDKGGQLLKVKGSCGHTWQAGMGNLLNANMGCPICYKFSSIADSVTAKEFKLGERIVLVKGYEVYALKKLLRTHEAKSITVFSEGKIEPVRYEHQGREREYWPDIKIRANRVIEVKSTYTLLRDFEVNKAKIIGCNKAGLRADLLLVLSPEKQIFLPKEWLSWKSSDMEIFIRRNTIDNLVILSMDPGKVNFAWSVIEARRPFSVKLLATGMIHNTVKDLTKNLREQVITYSRELQEIIEEYQVNSLIMERFLSRGMGGTTIEVVNLMIGAALMTAQRTIKRQKLITAAQWKNAFNRVASLEKFYEGASCNVHQADSIGIGLYGAASWLDEEPFSNVSASYLKSMYNIIPKVNYG